MSKQRSRGRVPVVRGGIFLVAAGLLIVGGTSARPASADEASAIRQLEQFQFGGNGAALDEIAQQVAASRSEPAARARMAQALAGVLSSSAPFAAKQFACRQLVFVAGPDQVPALSALVNDPELSHYALVALEGIPGNAVDDALLKALPASQGRPRLEIMDTLADRGNRKIIPELITALKSKDGAASEAAAFDLARLGGGDAYTALEGAFVDAERKIADAPGATSLALGDALLQLAHRTRGPERLHMLRDVTDRMESSAREPSLHAAALELLVEADPASAVPALSSALRDDGSPRQRVAAKLARTVPGSNATRSLGALLSDLTPRGKVLLIDALADRGDSAAAPALAPLCSDADNGIRAAALRALGRVGDVASVDTLVAAAATGDTDTRAAARAALAQLRGKDVDSRLNAAMGTGPVAQRVEAIRAVGERNRPEAIAPLLEQAAAPDRKVSSAALHVLRDNAGQPQLPRLIALLLAAPAGERDDQLDAVATIARRGANENERTGSLLAALSQAKKPADRGDLLTALGQVGGPHALAALKDALSGGNAETKSTALGVLAEWQTDEPMADLLRVAKSTQNDQQRTVALRGYIRMIGLDDHRAPAASLALYRDAAALAKRADDRRQLLAGLGKLGSLQALEYAQTFTKDDEVKAEAELAVVTAAASTAGAYREQTRAALDPIARSSANEEIRKRAQSLLDTMGKFGDYITAWEVSPAYEKEGVDYQGLFNMAFPPEQAGASVPWRLMPAGTNPAQPWLLDLLALHGGEQRVAYLRTSVWSDAAKDVLLQLGSDDGVKAWWNGQVVAAHNVPRAVAPGQEKAKVTLKAGWNQLLLKITQNNQGWGAVGRITNADGSPLTGLRFSPRPEKETAPR